MRKGWYGVDLDGTLAYYKCWQGNHSIGEPVPRMLERVLKWLAEGRDVRIFTARVSSNNPHREEAMAAIKAWCIKYIGRELPMTAEKDFGMIELWDDRCVQVIPNEGIAIQELLEK